MKRASWIAALITTQLVTAQLVAQTYVVDAQGGPGANFTSIATAVAAVPSGAVLLVRPGQYTAFGIDGKSLTVIATSSAEINDLSAYIPIRNLTATQHVTIRGFDLVSLLGPGRIDCIDNFGTVVIDACRGLGSNGSGASMRISNCLDVRIRNCVFFPLSGLPLTASDSQVRVAQSILVNSALAQGSQVNNSSAEFANVWFGGGFAFAQTAPLSLSNSQVRLLGACHLSTTWQIPGTSGPVITGQGSVRLDPLVTTATGGVPPFAPTIQVTVQPMPVVAADTDGPLGHATATLVGPTNGVGVLFLGLPGPALALPGWPDAIVLLAGTENLQAQGSLATPLTASYTVPPHPLLQGVRVCWQGASLDAMHGAQISNGVTYVHY